MPPGSPQLLRQWAEVERGDRPRRRFRTTAAFDGEPDLAVRSKEIVRDAWASEEPRSA